MFTIVHYHRKIMNIDVLLHLFHATQTPITQFWKTHSENILIRVLTTCRTTNVARHELHHYVCLCCNVTHAHSTSVMFAVPSCFCSQISAEHRCTASNLHRTSKVFCALSQLFVKHREHRCNIAYGHEKHNGVRLSFVFAYRKSIDLFIMSNLSLKTKRLRCTITLLYTTLMKIGVQSITLIEHQWFVLQDRASYKTNGKRCDIIHVC